MKEEMLFQQMEFIRFRTLAMLDATTEEMADMLPSGFKNNIRWNFGHILVSHELLIYSFAKVEPNLPSNYPELFQMNTNPSDWKMTPPSLPELRQLLSDQTKRTIKVFSGRLSEEGGKPFKLNENVQFTTIGEVLNFANWHEGLHQGTINSLKRASGVENLWKLPEVSNN